MKRQARKRPPEEVARDERSRRGFLQTARNTFGMLYPKVLPVEGGYRDARIFDGGFEGWLCPHVHKTEKAAEECRRDRESLLGPAAKPKRQARKRRRPN